MNGAILKQIKISKNLHSRFTAKYVKVFFKPINARKYVIEIQEAQSRWGLALIEAIYAVLFS